MAEDLQYHENYAEEVVLDDGERLRIRPIRASDKARLAEALLALSPRSQYFRFFTAKSRLTDGELRYLTEVDGYDHFAVGVSRIAHDGSEAEGVGVARFVRLRGEPRVAEPAVVVIDSMQGRGIGRMLMVRIMAAAIERGVEVFRSEFLATNTAMQELIKSLSPAVNLRRDGSVVVAEFPLGRSLPAVLGPTSEDPHHPLVAMLPWLRMAADRTVELRRAFGMVFSPSELKDLWARLREDLGRKRS